jgi:hypothetical protein
MGNTMMDDDKKKKGLSVAIVMGGPKKMSDSKESDEDTEEMDSLDVDEDELEAFKEFESGKSTEDKAKALKAFIKMCGGY